MGDCPRGGTGSPLPTSFALLVNPLLFPAFPGRRAKRREGTAAVGLGRGGGLRGCSSAPAVHGRRGCPPPPLAPRPEGRESEQAGDGRSGHGSSGGGRSSLGGGRREPDSGRRRRRLGACSSLPRVPAPRRQTDRPQGPRPPHPPPGPPGQLPPSFPPSFRTPLSPGVLREGEKSQKNTFLSCRTKGAWKEHGYGGGGEGKKNPQLCLCACVVRPTYDKLRRILKPYHELGCRGGGIHSELEPPSLGSPSPGHLLKERERSILQSLPDRLPHSALLLKPPTR